jgi:hypothetical protein
MQRVWWSRDFAESTSHGRQSSDPRTRKIGSNNYGYVIQKEQADLHCHSMPVNFLLQVKPTEKSSNRWYLAAVVWCCQWPSVLVVGASLPLHSEAPEVTEPYYSAASRISAVSLFDANISAHRSVMAVPLHWEPCSNHPGNLQCRQDRPWSGFLPNHG